ncbi:MAG: hypothetical protein LBL97_08275 [Prevotellaceae bacterium]|nr:hypothetical protein [Prevotellaceae bacterium]
MLDYDTLIAISLLQRLGGSIRPMQISNLIASIQGQVILQQLRDAKMVTVYPESGCCALARPLTQISLLDVLVAIGSRLSIDPKRVSNSQEKVYGKAGAELDRIRHINRNLLAAIPLFDIWLSPQKATPSDDAHVTDHPTSNPPKIQQGA